MKNKDHLEDLFRTVRELPPEVALSDVEKFVLAQPVLIYQSAPTMTGGKGLYTFKNIIAMISSISLIGTAVFFLGKGDPKPSASAVPLPDTAPYVAPATMYTDSTPADLSAPAAKPDTAPVPTESNRSAYPFPIQSDTAPLSEGLIGPRSLTMTIPAFPAPPETKRNGECDDDHHVISVFSKELRKDGIIRPDVSKFGFRISHKDFYVNGKKQPQKVFAKYVDLFGKQLGRKDVKGAEMSATVGPGNCSISLSLDDSWDNHTFPVSTSTSSTVSASVNTGTSVAVSASGPRVLEDFSQIEVRGSVHVKVAAGDRYSVVSDGRENPPGVAVVEKGRLVISYAESFDEVLVTLPADRLKNVGVSGSGWAMLTTPFGGVASLKVAGSGSIKVEKGIETPELSMQVLGSGRILAREMKAGKLTGSVSGSGSIEAAGNAGSLLNSISGSGLINMDKLDTDSVDCEILGSGTLRIGTVRTRLKATIQGSGGVSYSGTPTVEKKISGSGTVNAR